MKRAYLIIPALAVAAFGGYYSLWSTELDDKPNLHGDEARHLRQASMRDKYEGRDGRREAEEDLKGGKVAILHYGREVEWATEYSDLMQQRYGIEDRWIAGCLISKPLTNYADAYNEVMTRWIVNKFGANIFGDVAKDASHIYKQKHTENRANQSKDPAA